jgi:hypothetical protein
MSKPLAKHDPQTWANRDHLRKVYAENGPEAGDEEFARIFSPEGSLPPIEREHLEIANSHRRWDDLPLLPVPDHLAKAG